MIESAFEIIDELIRDPDTITANRLSIINGKCDVTELGAFLDANAKAFLDKYASFYNEDSDVLSKCIAHIILAEVYYQKGDCYNSLIMVNSALAFLESDGIKGISDEAYEKMSDLNENVSEISKATTEVLDEAKKTSELTSEINVAASSSGTNSDIVLGQIKELTQMSEQLKETVASFRV